jgi:hypothetical protein
LALGVGLGLVLGVVRCLGGSLSWFFWVGPWRGWLVALVLGVVGWLPWFLALVLGVPFRS